MCCWSFPSTRSASGSSAGSSSRACSAARACRRLRADLNGGGDFPVVTAASALEMTMLYRHDIKGCMLDRVGAVGLCAGELSAVLHRLRPSLDKLREMHAGGDRLLALPARRDDLAPLLPIVATFRRFEHVVVLGTGGSSLGGQTLYALAEPGFGRSVAEPRLHFMDNIDPATFAELVEALDLARTGVIAISKSGSTAETL